MNLPMNLPKKKLRRELEGFDEQGNRTFGPVAVEISNRPSYPYPEPVFGIPIVLDIHFEAEDMNMEAYDSVASAKSLRVATTCGDVIVEEHTLKGIELFSFDPESGECYYDNEERKLCGLGFRYRETEYKSNLEPL